MKATRRVGLLFELLRYYCVIDLDCNMSTSKVNDIVYLVVIIQKNSVQIFIFHKLNGITMITYKVVKMYI